MSMGYRHSEQEILDAAVQVALDEGVVGLTYRSVGRSVGIADRTVVYYFPTKGALVLAVLERITEELQDLLAGALGESRQAQAALLERTWAALATTAADPAVRILLETFGLAVRGQQPYPEVVAGVLATWTSWVADHLAGEPGTRPARAAAVVATLDGLLLTRAIAGDAAAASAASGLGLRPVVTDPAPG